MSILKKHNILKLVAIFMLVGMMVGAFAMHAKSAFAATAGACGTSTHISGNDNTTPGVPNCDVAITAGSLAVSGLSFTSDGTTVGGAVTTGTNTFTFGAIVTDVRETQEGWQLQALSDGLSTSGHAAIFIPLTVGTSGSSATCDAATPTPVIAGSTCPAPTVLSTQLNGTTPTTFVTELADGTNPLSGTATIGVTGTYNIPVGTYPGAYSGAITLSLLNTFS
jgi:hypothetical protein